MAVWRILDRRVGLWNESPATSQIGHYMSGVMRRRWNVDLPRDTAGTMLAQNSFVKVAADL
jgi:hypothetical protein